jgi:hypothetical protein
MVDQLEPVEPAAAIDTRVTEISALRRELFTAERSLANMHELERRMAEVNQLAAALAAHVDGLELENDRLNKANLVFSNSHSWRITQPLRTIGSLLRRRS